MDGVGIRFAENLTTQVSGQAYLHKVEHSFGIKPSSAGPTENVSSPFFSGLKQVICQLLFSGTSHEIASAYQKLRQDMARHYQSLMHSPGGALRDDFTKNFLVTLDGNNKLFQVRQRYLSNGHFELKLGFASDENQHKSIEITELNNFVRELLTAAAADTFLALKSEEIQMESCHYFLNRVFVLTNELHSEEVIESLKQKPITGNTGIYTSGLFALDLAAAERAPSERDLENIIVIDRAGVVREFWTSMEKIIRQTESRIEAEQKISELITQNSKQYFPEGGSASAERYTISLQEKSDQGISFLSTDEKYKKIRTIFCNDRFAFISLDLCNQPHTKRLGDLIAASTLNIDTLYISNICGLLFSALEEARSWRDGGDYESIFSARLMHKLCVLNRYEEAGTVYELSFDGKKNLFSQLFDNEKEHEQALSTIKMQSRRREADLEVRVQDAENACNLFVASMENILGKSYIDTHLIHASRQCDNGCCSNPLRIDQAGNLSEVLKIKTPCDNRGAGRRS